MATHMFLALTAVTANNQAIIVALHDNNPNADRIDT
jgi:hypothetical protein